VHTVTSLHSSAVPAEQVNAIAADYLALERARIHRRLCVARFGVTGLVLAVATVVRWLPATAAWVSIATCLAVPGWALLVEHRCVRRLKRHLDQVLHKKVVKSS
jgi:uncharacterized membrane protein